MTSTKDPRSNTVAIVLLVSLQLFVVREWFLPGMPQTHDAEVHISRAAMFATSLREGNLLPRWAGYFNWGYGTPSILFLYPGLPYLGALVHLLTGLTFIQTYKVFIVTSYLASSVLWFRLLKAWGFSTSASVVSTLVYILAPYRLLNLFVRGALAEHLGFALFPLLLLVFTRILSSRSRRWVAYGSLAVAASILTHNLSALLYLPIVSIFPFVAAKICPTLPQISLTHFVRYYGSIALGILLAGFFWIPALIESRYTLASWMFTNRDWYADHFLTFRQLIWSAWGYGWSLPGVENDGMSFQIGIAQWIMILLSIVFILRRKKFIVHSSPRPPSLPARQYQSLAGGALQAPAGGWFIVFSLTLVVIGIFMTLPVSNPVWHLTSLLPKFQFPWRFLSYVVIGSSLLAAAVAQSIKKRALVIALGLLPVLTTISYWRIAGPSSLTEAFLSDEYVGTSDTGETTPIWAVRFQEKKARAPMEIVSVQHPDSVTIIPGERTQERHEYRIAAAEPARLVENTLYFPGWTVLVDGNPVPVEYQDQSWRGLITFPVERGEHDVVLEFRETLVRKFSNAVSLVSIGILLVILRVQDNARVARVGKPHGRGPRRGWPWG